MTAFDDQVAFANYCANSLAFIAGRVDETGRVAAAVQSTLATLTAPTDTRPREAQRPDGLTAVMSRLASDPPPPTSTQAGRAQEEISTPTVDLARQLIAQATEERARGDEALAEDLLNQAITLSTDSVNELWTHSTAMSQWLQRYSELIAVEAEADPTISRRLVDLLADNPNNPVVQLLEYSQELGRVIAPHVLATGRHIATQYLPVTPSTMMIATLYQDWMTARRLSIETMEIAARSELLLRTTNRLLQQVRHGEELPLPRRQRQPRQLEPDLRIEGLYSALALADVDQRMFARAVAEMAELRGRTQQAQLDLQDTHNRDFRHALLHPLETDDREMYADLLRFNLTCDPHDRTISSGEIWAILSDLELRAELESRLDVTLPPPAPSDKPTFLAPAAGVFISPDYQQSLTGKQLAPAAQRLVEDAASDQDLDAAAAGTWELVALTAANRRAKLVEDLSVVFADPNAGPALTTALEGFPNPNDQGLLRDALAYATRTRALTDRDVLAFADEVLETEPTSRRPFVEPPLPWLGTVLVEDALIPEATIGGFGNKGVVDQAAINARRLVRMSLTSQLARSGAATHTLRDEAIEAARLIARMPEIQVAVAEATQNADTHTTAAAAPILAAISPALLVTTTDEQIAAGALRRVYHATRRDPPLAGHHLLSAKYHGDRAVVEANAVGSATRGAIDALREISQRPMSPRVTRPGRARSMTVNNDEVVKAALAAARPDGSHIPAQTVLKSLTHIASQARQARTSYLLTAQSLIRALGEHQFPQRIEAAARHLRTAELPQRPSLIADVSRRITGAFASHGIHLGPDDPGAAGHTEPRQPLPTTPEGPGSVNPPPSGEEAGHDAAEQRHTQGEANPPQGRVLPRRPGRGGGRRRPGRGAQASSTAGTADQAESPEIPPAFRRRGRRNISMLPSVTLQRVRRAIGADPPQDRLSHSTPPTTARAARPPGHQGREHHGSEHRGDGEVARSEGQSPAPTTGRSAPPAGREHGRQASRGTSDAGTGTGRQAERTGRSIGAERPTPGRPIPPAGRASPQSNNGGATGPGA